MARPLKADADATRRRILASAIALFGERGPDGVSVRAIGADAGVSLATVHHYFGSKAALYRACIDAMYDELVAMQPQLIAAVRAGGEPAALIDRVVRTAFRFARAHQVQMRLLLREVVSHGELPDDRRERGQVPFLDQVPAAMAAVAAVAGDVRLILQSASFLIARYAISSPAELELLTRARGDDAVTAVEDHLVRAVTAMFP